MKGFYSSHKNPFNPLRFLLYYVIIKTYEEIYDDNFIRLRVCMRPLRFRHVENGRFFHAKSNAHSSRLGASANGFFANGNPTPRAILLRAVSSPHRTHRRCGNGKLHGDCRRQRDLRIRSDERRLPQIHPRRQYYGFLKQSDPAAI